nr:MAG TPA: hypothetical protein [Caudoviricetes sp.]
MRRWLFWFGNCQAVFPHTRSPDRKPKSHTWGHRSAYSALSEGGNCRLGVGRCSAAKT